MEDILNLIGEHKEILYFVILSVFVGVEVIGNVPTVLHTPLMSGANAIHGVVIVGAINVVGGFVVTDRMLEMFKKKK